MGWSNNSIKPLEQTSHTTAAHEAAYDGDVERLGTFIVQNHEFEALDGDGRTPLFYAAAQNRVKCAALLMDHRSDLLEMKDGNGDTALHVASYYGHWEVMELLLKSIADVSARNNKGFTPAHVASNAACLELLNDFDANMTAPDFKGRTPLFCACATGKVECVEYFVGLKDSAAMLDIDDINGDTALHAAACNGCTGSLRCMQKIISGKHLATRNKGGYTPADLAQLNSHPDCELLLNDLLTFHSSGGNRHSSMTDSSVGFHQHQQLSQRPQTAAIASSSGSSWDAHQDFGSSWNGEGFAQNNTGYTNSYAATNQDYSAQARPQTSGVFNEGGHAFQEFDPSSWTAFSHTEAIVEDEPYYHHQQVQHTRPQTAAAASYSSAGFGYEQQYYDQSTAVPVLSHQDSYAARPGTAYPQSNYYSADGFHQHQRPDTANSYFEENSHDAYTADRLRASTVQESVGEWAQYLDPDTNEPFWWNALTGQCRWQPPETLADENGANYDSEAHHIRQRSYKVAVHGDWTECQDPVSNDTFFYNNVTGECEWELPPDVEAERLRKVDEEQKAIEAEAIKQAEEWVWAMRQKKLLNANESINWSINQDPETGAVYYTHKQSGETSWTEPEEITLERQRNEQLKTSSRDVVDSEELDQVIRKAKEETAEEIRRQVQAAMQVGDQQKERIAEQIRQEAAAALKAQKEAAEKLQQQLEEAKAQAQLVGDIAESVKSPENQARVAARIKKQLEAKFEDAAKKQAELELAEKQRQLEEERQERMKKEAKQKAVEKLKDEKAELLAEHTEELKQLAAVLSADRQRQNQKLQEKLKARRKSRSLRRAAALSEANEKRKSELLHLNGMSTIIESSKVLSTSTIAKSLLRSNSRRSLTSQSFAPPREALEALKGGTTPVSNSRRDSFFNQNLKTPLGAMRTFDFTEALSAKQKPQMELSIPPFRPKNQEEKQEQNEVEIPQVDKLHVTVKAPLSIDTSASDVDDASQAPEEWRSVYDAFDSDELKALVHGSLKRSKEVKFFVDFHKQFLSSSLKSRFSDSKLVDASSPLVLYLFALFRHFIISAEAEEASSLVNSPKSSSNESLSLQYINPQMNPAIFRKLAKTLSLELDAAAVDAVFDRARGAARRHNSLASPSSVVFLNALSFDSFVVAVSCVITASLGLQGSESETETKTVEVTAVHRCLEKLLLSPITAASDLIKLQCAELSKRSSVYKDESKRLAQKQVRKVLQTNVQQLKIVYMHYARVARAARGGAVSKNSIGLCELILLCKTVGVVPRYFSLKQLYDLYEDMFLIKFGSASSNAKHEVPFNQLVQLLFHASIRFISLEEDDLVEETKSPAEQPQSAHLYVVKLLRLLSENEDITRSVKGFKAFTF